MYLRRKKLRQVIIVIQSRPQPKISIPNARTLKKGDNQVTIERPLLKLQNRPLVCVGFHYPFTGTQRCTSSDLFPNLTRKACL